MVPIMEARCFSGLERLEVRDWLSAGVHPASVLGSAVNWIFLPQFNSTEPMLQECRENRKLKIVQNVNFNLWNKKVFSEEDESIPLNRYLLFLFGFHAFLYGSRI